MWGLLRRWVTPEETVLVVEPSYTKVDPVACANERLNAVRARVDEELERSMK